MASATEEMDEDEEEDDEHEERVAMGLSPLGEGRPSALGVPESGAGGGRGADDAPKLFELADELGGQGTSGLRWSHLAIFDDQVRFYALGVVAA